MGIWLLKKCFKLFDVFLPPRSDVWVWAPCAEAPRVLQPAEYLPGPTEPEASTLQAQPLWKHPEQSRKKAGTLTAPCSPRAAQPCGFPCRGPDLYRDPRAPPPQASPAQPSPAASALRSHPSRPTVVPGPQHHDIYEKAACRKPPTVSGRGKRSPGGELGGHSEGFGFFS